MQTQKSCSLRSSSWTEFGAMARETVLSTPYPLPQYIGLTDCA